MILGREQLNNNSQLLLVKNGHATNADKYDVGVINGYDSTNNCFTISRPNSTSISSLLVALVSDIDAGMIGTALLKGIMLIKYDTNIASEKYLRIVNDSWQCTPDATGEFTIIDYDNTYKIASVVKTGSSSVDFPTIALTVTAVGTETITAEDVDLNEYTVYCTIKGGGTGNSLANATPFIEVDDPIFAIYNRDESKWRYPSLFQAVRSVLA